MKILDRLLDEKAPYVLQLLGVYLMMVSFLAVFFLLLPLVLSLGDGGMVDFPVFDAPMTIGEFVLQWAKFANAAGLVAIAIRVAHDLLSKA